MTAERPQPEQAPLQKTRLGNAGLKLAVGVWVLLVAAGMMRLNQYANQPSSKSAIVAEWPAAATVERQADCRQLLVFLHPKCGCSVATLRQLAAIYAQCADDLHVTALFYCPPDESSDWVESHLWKHSQRLPNVSCLVDYGGQQAYEFGVTTSGHLLLFDDRGRRVFEGGITTARAHEGHGFGAEALLRRLQGEASNPVSFPVFGCAIHAGSPTK